MTAATASTQASQAGGFPLERYLARIGYHGPRAATLEVLRALHRLHPEAIAYENLDPLLGSPVSITATDLADKLLSGSRGGYCFEQNGLFALALEALGFSFVGLAARVLWNQPEELITARSHHVLLVDLPEGRYLADIGFGGMTPTAPLRLVTEEVQATPHEPMRLVRRGEDYVLQLLQKREADDAIWKTLYRFDLQPQHPIDYVVGNHYVSTFSGSIFRSSLMAARPVADGRFALMNNRLTRYQLDGSAVETQLDKAATIRQVLRDSFNLVVPDPVAFDRRVIELGFVTE